jgi:hypothetical protein
MNNNKFINVDYETLALAVKAEVQSEYAQSGISREVVSYVYAEILEAVQKNLFSKRVAKIAPKKVLFELTFTSAGVLVCSNYHLSSKIKFFKKDKTEINIIPDIESAMKKVGLFTKINLVDKYEKQMEVFVTAVKEGEEGED